MVSTKEVFDRMKRYRTERNELRKEMEKFKDLPQQILELQEQVAQLKQQVKESSSPTIDIEKLKSELLIELDNKMQQMLSKSLEDLSTSNSVNIEKIEGADSLEKETDNLSPDEVSNLSDQDQELGHEEIEMNNPFE